MINIVVNGETKTISSSLTIAETIQALDYRGKGFAVALNGTFVALSEYENMLVCENDRLEILAPVQGG